MISAVDLKRACGAGRGIAKKGVEAAAKTFVHAHGFLDMLNDEEAPVRCGGPPMGMAGRRARQRCSGSYWMTEALREGFLRTTSLARLR